MLEEIANVAVVLAEEEGGGSEGREVNGERGGSEVGGGGVRQFTSEVLDRAVAIVAPEGRRSAMGLGGGGRI